MSADFNPQSLDATLAKILANQDHHTETLGEIRAQAAKTNGRVTELERDKWYVRGVTAGLAVLAPGAWEWFRAKS